MHKEIGVRPGWGKKPPAAIGGKKISRCNISKKTEISDPKSEDRDRDRR